MNDSINRLLDITSRFLFGPSLFEKMDRSLYLARTLVNQQPPPITGYRPLSETEIALMNQIKAKGAELEVLLAQVGAHLDGTTKAGDPRRWVAIGRTHFQEGLMALTRAVAQPTSF